MFIFFQFNMFILKITFDELLRYSLSELQKKKDIFMIPVHNK